MFVKAIAGKAAAEGATLKTGNFEGDGSNIVTIPIEEGFDNVKLLSCSRTTSTGSASAVTGFTVSSNGDKYAFVNSSSQQGTMNLGLTYTVTGKNVRITVPVSYKFVKGLEYKYYYVV